MSSPPSLNGSFDGEGVLCTLNDSYLQKWLENIEPRDDGLKSSAIIRSAVEEDTQQQPGISKQLLVGNPTGLMLLCRKGMAVM